MCSIMLNIYDNLCRCHPLNIVAAFLPSIATLGSILAYPYFYPINASCKNYYEKHGFFHLVTMQPAFLALPYVLLIVLPLSNQDITLDFQNIIYGVIFIDTVEYWRHRMEHSIRFLYRNAHKEHHQQRPMTTLEGFRNQTADLVLPLIPFTLYVLMVKTSFIEIMILAALAIVATYADHTLTGDKDYDQKKFHHVHHTTGWNTNFQQPFFSYWDRICCTIDAKSHSKGWCPFLP